MTAAATFTERDVEKAVRGATKAGMKVGRIEVDRTTGRIIVVAFGSPDMQNKATNDPDAEIKGWLAENGDDRT